MRGLSAAVGGRIVESNLAAATSVRTFRSSQ
jgi:hypothetical protein